MHSRQAYEIYWCDVHVDQRTCLVMRPVPAGEHSSSATGRQVPDIGRAMELGREAAGFVSATFIKPIKLEFEKARGRNVRVALGTHAIAAAVLAAGVGRMHTLGVCCMHDARSYSWKGQCVLHPSAH